MKELIGFFVRQGIFSNLLTIFLIFLGVSSLFLIRKEVFPNVAYDIITVNTIFPGSSAEEAERLVTNVIERELKELDGIRDINSVSRQNQSFIVIQLDPDEITSDRARQDTQNIIDRITNLPADAETPVVTELDSRIQPIMTIALINRGNIDEIRHREIARRLEYDIEFLPGVARVNPRGMRELEIRVEADLEKLKFYRVSLEEISEALKRQNLSIPGGNIDTRGEHYKNPQRIVRTIGEFASLEDVEMTVVRSNELGRPLFVKDLANVYFALEKTNSMVRTNHASSINLTVMKKEKADAIQMVSAIKEYVEKVTPELEEGLELKIIQDDSEFIERRLGVLSNNLIVGLLLIVAILSLVLPFRVALVTAICIPTSFLGTLLYFYLNDVSMNLLSMLGLIIVAGMLVDGAIVVTDNVVRKMKNSNNLDEGCIEGTYQVWAPITASLLTTILAFLPMMFMSGIFGKFVYHIPLGVVVALIFSLGVSLFILPYQIKAWYAPVLMRSSSGEDTRSMFDRFWDLRIVPLYQSILRLALKTRYLVVIGGILFFTLTMLVAQKGMRLILFPPGMVEIFIVRSYAPIGTSLELHQRLLEPVEKAISELPGNELRNFSTLLGTIESSPGDPKSRVGAEYAQITVYLTPSNKRDRDAIDIIEEFRERFRDYPGLEQLAFDQISGGPPVGAPVSIGVRGDDYDEILKVVERIETVLHETPGVVDISNNFSMGKEEYRIMVNSAEAAAASVSVANIGATIRAMYEGVIATSLRTFDEEIDIRVTMSQQYRKSADALNSMFVPNQRGDLIPISRVSRIEVGQGIETYEHDNFRREVRISADVLTDMTSSKEVMGGLQRQREQFLEGFEHLTLNFTGESRDTDESLVSLARAFVVALLGIFFILILLFAQILQPFLIILTIPLGIIAAIWTFFFHGLPISFMGLLGVVALGGVIVNNSIVFIDFVNQGRAEGLDRFESIIEAGKIRIRAIFLTTVTTFFGLIPTAYGLGGMDRFIMPLALVLAWGIFAGSIMMIVVIPAALSVVDDIQSLGKRLGGTRNNFFKLALRNYRSGGQTK